MERLTSIARSPANQAARAGGGIENIGGTLVVDNSPGIFNNSAGINGGGIHVSGAGITNLTTSSIRENTAGSEGGGLWNSALGTMTINGGSIESNTASGAEADNGGGGIFNDGGTLTIGDLSAVTIVSNAADGLLGSGGGIFNGLGGELTIDGGSIIAQNTAERAGGGIEDASGAATTVVLLSGTVERNNAGNGGGLHVTGDGNVMVGVALGGPSFDFLDNTGRSQGGGIWNDTGTLTIERSEITGNLAAGDAANDGGGGIFNNAGSLIVNGGVSIGIDGAGNLLSIANGVSISGNVAVGAMGSGGGIFSLAGNVNIAGANITDNEAVRAGGGIEIVDATATLSLLNLTGNDVSADDKLGFGVIANPGNGGGLHISGAADVALDASFVTGNIAQAEGGGLWNSDVGTLRVGTLTTIEGNVARGNADPGSGSDAQGGGGIFNNGGTLIVDSGLSFNISGAIGNVNIRSNAASGAAFGSGGGILSIGGDVTIAGATDANRTVTISGNEAVRAGGGIEIVAGNVTITNTTIDGNDVSGADVTGNGLVANPGNGGGLHITGDANVSLVGGVVTGNVAAQEGGGLWNSASGVLSINGTAIESNVAESASDDQGGGGVFNNGGSVDITNGSINANLATANDGAGGGVMTVGGTLTINGGSISGNQAATTGGGIENNGGIVTLNDAVLDSNIAGAGGGGLSNTSGGNLQITDSVISANIANGALLDDGGGGVFNNGSSANLTLVTISGNSAPNGDGSGGGVFGLNGSITIDQSMITDNSVARDGGGVFIQSAHQINNTTISNNQAGTGGGAFLSGRGAFVNSTLSSNEARGDGGGVLDFSGFATFVHTTIVGNRSDSDGVDGGVGGGVVAKVSGSEITNLFNSIVAGNVTGAPAADVANDIGGDDVSAESANNLIGDPATAGGLTEGTLGNLVGDGTGALLALDQIIDLTLEDNGGPTLTHDLAAGSRALNTGNRDFGHPGDDRIPGTNDANESTLFGDQRGGAFDREFGDNVDVGAFEVQVFDGDDFVVTTTVDTVDASDGETSLREAIFAANFDPDANIITFDAGVFANPTSIDLMLGELLVNQSVVIQGPGAQTLTINASADARHFNFGGAGANEYEIHALTLANGDVGPAGGGAISMNDADDTLLVADSIIRDNMGDGAIQINNGNLRVQRSAIINNSGAFGGGLSLVNATTIIENTTISGNTASSNGGGINLFASGTDAVSSLVVTHSTITENSALFGANLNNLTQFDAGESMLTIANSIVSNPLGSGQNFQNTDLGSTGAGPVITSLGHNIWDDVSGPVTATGDQTNTDPMLDPVLALNGGTVPTHALLLGSPAIEAGDGSLSASLPATDGRGADRVVDLIGIANVADGLDIGAFEFIDLVDPTIDVPADLSREGDTEGGLDATTIAAFLTGATATDDLNPNPIISNDAPAVFQVGVTTVTFTANDENGNTTEATAVVTVTDTGAPTLTVPNATTIEGDTVGGASNTGAAFLAFAAMASATDIVDGTVVVTHNAPSVLPVGDTDVVFTAMDTAGNPATETVTITIADTDAPTLTVPGDSTIEGKTIGGASNTATEFLDFAALATATDVVDGSVSVTHDAPSVLPVGDTEVTFTATDDAGNATTATATVTVEFVSDFGDAPSAADSGFVNDYPVTRAQDGAQHTVGTLFLGSLVDAEGDGQPNEQAGLTGNGDDGNGDADEEGVVQVTQLISTVSDTTASSFVITASDTGKVDAWIDFNQDGDWDDANEQIATSVDVNNGSNLLSFTIPAGASIGDTAARFRLSSTGGLSPTGPAVDGEVEDYWLSILDGSTSPDVTISDPEAIALLILEGDQVVVRGSSEILFSVPVQTVGVLNVDGQSSDDTITLDFSGGNVIPTAGLNLDGAAGTNTLRFAGGDSDFSLTDETFKASNFSLIDLGDANTNVVTIDAASVAALSTTTTPMIRGGDGDTIRFADPNDWRYGDPITVEGRFVHQIVNSVSDQILQVDLSNSWHNVVSPSDASNNSLVRASDALLLINELNRNRFSDPVTRVLVDPSTVTPWPGIYYDQNNDSRLTALDAVRIINEIDRNSRGQSEQESEAVALQFSSVASSDDTASLPVSENIGIAPERPVHDAVFGSLGDPSTARQSSLTSQLSSTEKATSTSAVDDLLSDASFFDHLEGT